MGERFKDIHIKNCTNYFFNDINIKNFDLNKTQDRWKVIQKYSIYSVYRLFFVINKINEYFKEINGNEYLALFPTDDGKETTNKYEELWRKIKDQIRVITINQQNYEENVYSKSDDIALNKTLELCNMIIVSRFS